MVKPRGTAQDSVGESGWIQTLPPGKVSVNVIPVTFQDPGLGALSGTMHFNCFIKEGKYGRQMAGYLLDL